MKNIIEQFIIDASSATKEHIEMELKKGYIGISELRKRSLTKSLDVEYIENIEKLFISNKIIIDEFIVADKYLKKYIQCLSDFWESYTYYNTKKSRGKFNLFECLKQKDILIKGYSDDECAKVLQQMENHWTSSNQIYTKYKINQVNKFYQR